MKIPTDAITLLYHCLDCGAMSTQPLTDIVECGTHTCDCGVDMKLSKEVEIKNAALKECGLR